MAGATLKEILAQYPELEEEDVADSGAQHDLARYLETLLIWFYRAEGYYVNGNMYVLQEGYKPVAPDVFVAKTQISPSERPQIDSWDLREPNRPAPAIVFEFASTSTWDSDVGKKIERYQKMGVAEYFAYDPNMPEPVWNDKKLRLRGWRYEDGAILKIEPNDQGWLWSSVLQRWLAPDDSLIQLYDEKGNRELSESEARNQQLEQERLALAKLEEKLEKLRQLGYDIDNI